MTKRIVSCLVAHSLCAVGVVLTVNSGLGVSPMSMPPYTVSRILGWELGLVQLCYFSLLVLVQIAILGRRFRPVRLLQVAVAVLIASVVAATGRVLTFQPTAYAGRLGLQLLGIAVCAVGIFLNIDANVMLNSPEGFVLALDERLPWRFSNIKVAADCGMVALSLVLGLCFLGAPAGLREGTLLNALLTGKVIGLLQGWFGPRLHRWHYGATDAETEIPAPIGAPPEETAPEER